MGSATTVLADRQDPFIQKFNQVLHHPYLQYNQGRLDLLYKLSWAEMIMLGLVGGSASYLCYQSNEFILKLITGVFAMGALGAMAYKLYRIHNKIPCLTFTQQGLQTDYAWLFSWGDLKEIKIEDVYEQVFNSHTVNPTDYYQYQSGNVEQKYVGRRVICSGKNNVRLWSVSEREQWLPITLNELIDFLEFYRAQYGS
jgi:hypothetical protein